MKLLLFFLDLCFKIQNSKCSKKPLDSLNEQAITSQGMAEAMKAFTMIVLHDEVKEEESEEDDKEEEASDYNHDNF
jgi:hypothetical protein